LLFFPYRQIPSPWIISSLDRCFRLLSFIVYGFLAERISSTTF
jgi:hypothetical protein